MTDVKLSPDIISLLEKTCGDSINNFKVIIHKCDDGRQGYLGEMVFVSLTRNSSNRDLHLVIKQSINANNSSNAELVEKIYFNEIYFYKNIWKEFADFQKSFSGKKHFEIAPKYYNSNDELNKELLLLENLKYSGFEMFPRDGAFDVDHIKLLMKSYGHFHGISAAYREHHPEKYLELTNQLRNSTEVLLGSDFFCGMVFTVMRVVDNFVEGIYKEKLKIFVEKPVEIAKETFKYFGKNPVINHGDCWSNNMMFKYNENGIPVDVRLLDFQICRNGSVVNDLSYLLYSGVEKDVLQKFDHYLNIYYNSFSDTLKTFSLDPEKIFTFEDLKNEWKDHWKFGFIMGVMILGNKLSRCQETLSIVELTENKHFDSVDEFYDKILESYDIDYVKYKEHCLDLVQHLCENNYL